MKKIAFAAAIAAGAVAAPAYAHDSDASGVFVGAVAGYDHVSISDGTDDGSSDGVLYGVTAGYDYDMGGAVLGVEVEAADSTAGTTENDVFVAGDTASLDAALDLYVGARLGFKAGENTMLYVKGGYTSGRVSLTYNDGTDTIEDSTDLSGFRVGAGAELAVGGLTTRLEYRYSDYGEYEFLGTPTGLTANRHQVAVVVGKKF